MLLHLKTFSFLTLAVLSAGTLHAQQPTAAESKMREQLRASVLQLRAAEAERAALQAGKAELESTKKELEEKLAEMARQTAANQEAAEKSIGSLNERLADRETEIAQLKGSLEKWKKAQADAAELAKKKEAERASLANNVVLLNRQVADQQRKNAEMFRLANEILGRYEKFGLGTAITAREPFVGTARVKLQNMVQDFADKLSEQRIKPEN